MYLAGGLSRENIGKAILEVNPFGADICSMLEKGKGLKDSSKIKEFFSSLNHAC